MGLLKICVLLFWCRNLNARYVETKSTRGEGLLRDILKSLNTKMECVAWGSQTQRTSTRSLLLRYTLLLISKEEDFDLV